MRKLPHEGSFFLPFLWYFARYFVSLSPDCDCCMANSLSARLTYRIMAVVLVMMVVIAEEAGFANVRTLQRRIQDAIGMSPVDYRLMLTRDF